MTPHQSLQKVNEYLGIDLKQHCATQLVVEQQVRDALPKPHADALHDLKPGEWIVVKDFRRKNWKAKC
ncbi:hypothetical protein QTP86_025121 [Hemibagrus guttatus]|nr:hypothetical protein QTP86_025121 [Hemibagrus guttatus]